MKYLRPFAWHIIPVTVVFIIIMGAQLFFITSLATILILIFGGEGDIIGPNFVQETIGVILVLLVNALLPCLLLLPIGLTLDNLTKNRPIWLKVVIPFPFFLLSALLTFPVFIYFYIEIPAIFTSWFSLIDELVILLVVLVVTFALFAPYWYALQIQRFLIWSMKDIEL